MIQMPYGTANFQIMIVKSYYTKQTLKIVRNKTVLDNSEEGDEAESSNESKAGGLEQKPEIKHKPKPK